MTEEVKKLLDKLPVSRVGFGDEMRELVYKLDVVILIEELSKWNKVEDSLPKKETHVLIKHVDENIHLCIYDGEEFLDPDDYIAWSNIVEWKYIN